MARIDPQMQTPPRFISAAARATIGRVRASAWQGAMAVAVAACAQFAPTTACCLAAADDGRAVATGEEVQPFWITLTDKPLPPRGITAADTPLTDRAIARRALRGAQDGGNLLGARDLPISADRLLAIRATGARIRAESRWMNAVSVEASHAQLRAIARLPFVARLAPVRPSSRVDLGPENTIDFDGGVAGFDYGLSRAQLAMIDLPAMHARGFTGHGMVIGVLDTGFKRTHDAFVSAERPVQVIAEWDFVKNDGNTAPEAGDPSSQHQHGTWVLGTLAAYKPGLLVGAAFDAQFVLAKTSDTTTDQPFEEDFYVAGLEFIEAQGADVATSSVGFSTWYSPEDLDGVTAVSTQAVNIATELGLVCVTAAGNYGHDSDPATHRIPAPADAFDVITVGAVAADGATWVNSTDGPSHDGRVKPEILARGASASTVSATNNTNAISMSGTSFSTPLVAASAALVLEAHPQFGVGEVRTALFATASDFNASGTHDPLFVRGYGIASAMRAAQFGMAREDLNLDGRVDAGDLAMMLVHWGPCGADAIELGACAADIDGDGMTDASDLAALLIAWSE